MKTDSYKLYSRVFRIYLPNIIKIDPYNFELYHFKAGAFLSHNVYKKAVLPQGNRAMPQVFFSVEVRQQHSLQV